MSKMPALHTSPTFLDEQLNPSQPRRTSFHCRDPRAKQDQCSINDPTGQNQGRGAHALTEASTGRNKSLSTFSKALLSTPENKLPRRWRVKTGQVRDNPCFMHFFYLDPHENKKFRTQLRVSN